MALDPVVLQQELESLIDRYDLAVATILSDPRVASDRGSEAVLAYVGLFTSDSNFPETALEFWESEGEAGHFYRPGPRGEMFISTVQSVDVLSPVQATFEVCSLKSIVIVDERGDEVSAEGGQTAGSGVAVLSDGHWLLRDLTRTAGDNCPDEATT